MGCGYSCYNHLMQKIQNLIKDLDIVRTQYLESRGFKVIRFWNNDIDTNIEGGLNEIIRQLNC